MVFCAKCGQKLPVGIGAMFSQEKPVEFEDGWYCYKCAKFKVESARR